MVNRAVWAGRARSPTVGGMATTLAQHQKTGPRYRPVPWSPRAWSQALYLTGGIPALVAVGFAARPRAALPLLFLVVIFVALPALTAMQRHRLRTTAGVDIPPQRPWTSTGPIRYARSPGTWRQFGYHLLAAPLLAAAALAALVTWLAGLAFTLVYAYAWMLNPDSLLTHGQSSPPAHLNRLAVPLDVWVTLAGIALLAAAPRLTTAVADLDAGAARILLGPSRAEELQHREIGR